MTTKIRIDKYLSHMGVGSRSEIKTHAKAGNIKVNGKITKDAGQIITVGKDIIAFHDEVIAYQEFIYLMMNKPEGVLSATEDKRDKTVIDLLPEAYQHFEPFPVGRLDKDAIGLLLLTNDGQLAHNLLSPKKHVDKEYHVEARGKVEPEHIQRFADGIALREYTALPAKLVLLSYDSEQDQSNCLVTIQEGKFHQIKKMFHAIGSEVTLLKRIRMGTLHLDENLELGAVRELTEDEQHALLQIMDRGEQ